MSDQAECTGVLLMNGVRKRRMRITRRILALGLVSGLAGGPSGIAVPSAAGGNAPPATAPEPVAPATAGSVSAPLERLTGTVGAVDLQARTVDLVMGVGHALRIQRVLLAPEVKVKLGAAEATTSVLTPGCIVRMECGHTRAGMVASTVTLLRTPTRARKP